MVDLAKIQGYIKIIDTNSDKMITIEEIDKADGKVPSVFLDELARLADGKDISVRKVYQGLGVEPNPENEENPFERPDLMPPMDCSGEEIRTVASLEEIPLGSHDGIRDARFCDISNLELSEEELLNLTIDESTIMNDAQRNMLAKPMEDMKNPGLGVRSLHAQGITGKGVRIAIIDQPLGEHREYSNRVIHYENYGFDNPDSDESKMSSMHGPSVTSIAVGETVGVAPDAQVVYFAASNYNFETDESYNSNYAKALNKILDMNEQLPPEEQVSVVSVSWGFDREAADYPVLEAALQRAADSGVFVISTALGETPGTEGMDLYGANREPTADVDSPESYELGAFLKTEGRAERIAARDKEDKDRNLFVPMDHRTCANCTSTTGYRYEGNDGGMSWAVPYLAGVYALARQVNPDITPQEFYKAAIETSDECFNKDDGTYVGRLINPARLIEAVRVQ